MFASNTEQAAGLFLRMRQVENGKSSVTGRFIQGQGKIHPGEAPFRIVLPLFGLGLRSSRCAEVIQRSSAVMDQSVQGRPLQIDLAALQQIIHLAASTLDLDVVRQHDFQIQCGRSKVDDVLQSCQINSGKLRRHVHFQSQKHMPWPLQGQSFMLTNQLGSVKALW